MFIAALAEATVGVGIVFPGVVLMFLAGAYTAEQGGSLPLVLGVAYVGTILGDTLSYGLGRWGSRWLSGGRLSRVLGLGSALVTGQVLWLIPFYHLHSATRAVGPFGSGALQLPLRVWMPLDYSGAMIANLVWVGSGAVLGKVVLTESGTLEQHPLLRGSLAVLAVVWLVLARRALLTRIQEIRSD